MYEQLQSNFPSISSEMMLNHLVNSHGIRVKKDALEPASNLSSPVKCTFDSRKMTSEINSLLNGNPRVNINDLHVSLVNSFMAHSKSLLKPSLISSKD